MTPSRLPEYPVFFLPLFPQFMKRVQLLLIPAKHQPDLLFLRHVPLSRVHLFTAIQLACLGLLWIIKSTPAAIIFPIMVTCGRVGWCPGGSEPGRVVKSSQEEESLLCHLSWLCLVGNLRTRKDGQGITVRLWTWDIWFNSFPNLFGLVNHR